MSHWAQRPSHGLFIYLKHSPAERPALCNAWLAALFEDLRLDAKSVKVATKNQVLQWRGYSAKVIDRAIETPDTQAITLMVGTPLDVHLGARLQLRPYPGQEAAMPWGVWLACESERWPVDVFVPFARHWMRIAAEFGEPISGGVVFAATLLEAKIEVSRESESNSSTLLTPAQMLFRERLWHDHRNFTVDKLRRLYPITLLGPRFASPRNVELLRAVGGQVEQVGASMILDAYPSVVSAWDPEYLVATVELRRLLWPLTIQNPADAMGLGVKDRFDVAARFNPPPSDPPVEEVKKELIRQMSVFEALVKRDREAGRVVGPVSGVLDVRD